jgi:tRNA A37 threonylcarbamoyladenosine dehydratase
MSEEHAHDKRPADRETAYRLHRRFDRIGRLVGDDGMTRLFRSHVMVIGLGGVGSFAVEALARSGVGNLTLVDFDRVCVTNTNRQLQALQTTVARPKAAVLAERAAQINPQCTVRPLATFYQEKNADALLADRPDFVVDAIDNVKAKCHLIATCRARGIPLVVSTGASGRIDPTAVRVVDLAETKVDPLADACRRVLRQKYDFPARGRFGVPSVFSSEPPADPHALHYDGGEGFRCVCPGGKNEFHSCEERPIIWGTAGFVTGAFGLACASVAVRAIAAGATPIENW